MNRGVSACKTFPAHPSLWFWTTRSFFCTSRLHGNSAIKASLESASPRQIPDPHSTMPCNNSRTTVCDTQRMHQEDKYHDISQTSAPNLKAHSMARNPQRPRESVKVGIAIGASGSAVVKNCEDTVWRCLKPEIYWIYKFGSQKVATKGSSEGGEARTVAKVDDIFWCSEGSAWSQGRSRWWERWAVSKGSIDPSMMHIMEIIKDLEPLSQHHTLIIQHPVESVRAKLRGPTSWSWQLTRARLMH